MKSNQPHEKKPIKLRALYPHLSEDEFREVELRWERYLEIVGRIYQRVTPILRPMLNFKPFSTKREAEKKKDKFESPWGFHS